MTGELPNRQRGGPREGAGRKAPPAHLERVALPLRLPRWLAEWIDAQEGTRAEVIEEALLKAHKLKPPKGEAP